MCNAGQAKSEQVLRTNRSYWIHIKAPPPPHTHHLLYKRWIDWKCYQLSWLYIIQRVLHSMFASIYLLCHYFFFYFWSQFAASNKCRLTKKCHDIKPASCFIFRPHHVLKTALSWKPQQSFRIRFLNNSPKAERKIRKGTALPHCSQQNKFCFCHFPLFPTAKSQTCSLWNWNQHRLDEFLKYFTFLWFV